jgi:hypothetical protein
MKNFFVIVAVLLVSLTGFAKDDLIFGFLPESRIQLSGDSTLRKYSAVSKTLALTGSAEARAAIPGLLPWTPTSVVMMLAVNTLESDSATLDEHMRENLKAVLHPVILLKLTKFVFEGDGSVSAAGHITVAGVTKPIELSATISANDGKFRIRGVKKLLMSDFAITPPTMMLGTLKTSDEIEISFDVVCLQKLNEKEIL